MKIVDWKDYNKFILSFEYYQFFESIIMLGELYEYINGKSCICNSANRFFIYYQNNTNLELRDNFVYIMLSGKAYEDT